jgi:hypothetical protein
MNKREMNPDMLYKMIDTGEILEKISDWKFADGHCEAWFQTQRGAKFTFPKEMMQKVALEEIFE